MAATATRSALDVNSLDPYAFLAVLGKRVIHPGGRRSTEELYSLAGFEPGQAAGMGSFAVTIDAGRAQHQGTRR